MIETTAPNGSVWFNEAGKKIEAQVLILGTIKIKSYMNLPTALWNHRLENDQTLSDYVIGKTPSRLPLTNSTSFVQIWSNRLEDAKNINCKDLEARANSVLHFLSENKEEVCLLIWTEYRISVLFSESSKMFIVVEGS